MKTLSLARGCVMVAGYLFLASISESVSPLQASTAVILHFCSVKTSKGWRSVPPLQKQLTSHGTLTVDPPGLSGNQGVHIHTDGDGRAFIVFEDFAPPEVFFGRVTLFLEDFPTSPDFAHFDVGGASCGTGT